MKRFALLIGLLTMSLPIFSQGLKPIVQFQASNDTLFCFTVPQSRELAKRLIEGTYNDSLVTHLQSVNANLHETIERKDNSINVLSRKVENIETSNANLQDVVGVQQRTIQAQAGTIRKVKRQRTVLGVALTVITVLAIL